MGHDVGKQYTVRQDTLAVGSARGVLFGAGVVVGNSQCIFLSLFYKVENLLLLFRCNLLALLLA